MRYGLVHLKVYECVYHENNLFWTGYVKAIQVPSRIPQCTIFLIMYFDPQVCLPLTKNLQAIRQSTRGKIKMELGGDMRSLRSVITIHTGAPALGRTLPSWSAMRRPLI